MNVKTREKTRRESYRDSTLCFVIAELSDEIVRSMVMARMHHSNPYRDSVSESTWQAAWLKCDGFGENIGREFAVEQCWDWSHVRDSSPGALRDALRVLIAGCVTDAS